MTVESPAAVVALFRGDVKEYADREIATVSNQSCDHGGAAHAFER